MPANPEIAKFLDPRLGRRRFIQVGCGGWGGHWVQEVMPRLIDELGVAEAAAVVDINPQTMVAAQARYHLPPEKCYTDLAPAFDENAADFAVIVVPPRFHESVVDIALAHGMHVLSEKPVADSMAACARIFRKVAAARRKMAVTMSHRFDQDKQSLESAIKSGEFGPLDYIVHRFTQACRAFGSWGEFRHKIPDPLLIEGTVHHFDMLRALAGADAKTVYAATWNPPWGEYAGDSTGFITLQMTNGVHCLYEGAKATASTMNGWEQDYLRAECRDGTLELDRRRLRVLRGGSPRELPATRELPLLQRPAWKNAWLAEQFVAWLNGGPEPANSLRDNIQCCALLFAAIESAHAGQPVDVQEFLRQHLGKE